MSRLLRAGFRRLFKDGTFWMLVVATLVIGTFTTLRSGLQAPTDNVLDTSMRGCAMYIWMAAVVFCVSFNGAEYVQGAIRNKVIAGNSRVSLYFSMLLTDLVAILILYAVYVLPYIAGGAMVQAKLDVAQFWLFALVAIGTCVAGTFLFQMLTALLPKGAIVCFVVAIGLFLCSMIIWSELQEPPTYVDYEMAEDGSLSAGEEVENPGYVSGTKRQVYEFLMDALPTGQSLLLAEGYEEPWMLVYSAAWCVLVGVTGVVLFRRKDLN